MSEEQNEPVDQLESGPSGTTPRSTPWGQLREAREARGLSLLDVAQHLKLTPRQIEAMEAGALDQLPGPAFAKGFVRNYARFLQVDAAQFNDWLEGPRPEQAVLAASPLGTMPQGRNWRYSSLPALLIVAVLLGLTVAGWHFSWFEQRDEQYVAEWMAQSAAALGAASDAAVAPVLPSAPLAAPPASLPAEGVSLAAAQAASSSSAASSSAASSLAASMAASSAGSSRPAETASAPAVVAGSGKLLAFRFEDESWVEVRDPQGSVLHSRLHPAGSEFSMRAPVQSDLVIGNASRVRLAQEGKAVDLSLPEGRTVARIRISQ